MRHKTSQPKHLQKIMVIDDDEGILDGFQAILESEGYDVTLAYNAEKLFLLTGTELPDLILLDILLSGSDGREICGKLKSNPATKSIPVIIISAHPGVEKSIKRIGADGFIAKPFDMDELLKIIREFI